MNFSRYYRGAFDPNIFTFHYVSIISHLRVISIPKNGVDLHSIMFLLFHTRDSHCYNRSFIYIPLCFYYFPGISIQLIHWCFHLHSIMFLLFQTFNPYSSDKCLYLHSIMFLLFPYRRPGRTCGWFLFTFHYVSIISRQVGRRRHSICIYIPLCFYYFGDTWPIKSEMSWFTFHYVSIISFRWFFFRCRPHSFTFHYVSIISEKPMMKLENQLYLHSIMFLLFHAQNWFYVKFVEIYIPLCFYYFRSSPFRVDARSWFTFHYVSIISWIHQACRISQLQFTFHYVSIISSPIPSKPTISSIYIPLCFYYFWTRSSERSRTSKFTFHYVSIISEALACDYFSADSIYIPLCFYYFVSSAFFRSSSLAYLHSIMFLLFPHFMCYDDVVFLIYIPLCFYYFENSSRVSGVSEKFTFHYVSIISMAGRRESQKRRTFTFHYVSIISHVSHGIAARCLYLHSIMFLLFRTLPRSAGVSRIIFTFHYVSIIS